MRWCLNLRKLFDCSWIDSKYEAEKARSWFYESVCLVHMCSTPLSVSQSETRCGYTTLHTSTSYYWILRSCDSKTKKMRARNSKPFHLCFVNILLRVYMVYCLSLYRHIKAVSNLKFFKNINLRGFYFKIIFKVFRTCGKKDIESDYITTQCKILKVIHVNLYSILHSYKCFLTVQSVLKLKQQ